MVDPVSVSALKAIDELDKAVGLIGRLLSKLRAQPDLAALRLSAALDEIAKTYLAVSTAISTYIGVDPAEPAARGQVQAIANHDLDWVVEQGRGHCHAIMNIYERYLRRWFEQVLDPNEQREYRDVFYELSGADSALFERLTGMVFQLADDAAITLQYILEDDPDQATQHIKATFKTLAPTQRALSQGMVEIYRLKNEFIQIAEVA
jgi:hypothetical protein